MRSALDKLFDSSDDLDSILKEDNLSDNDLFNKLKNEAKKAPLQNTNKNHTHSLHRNINC